MRNLTNYLEKTNNNFQLSYLEIRRSVGILGMALPVVLSLGTLFLSACPYLKDSISDYYYTLMGSALTGILCAIGLFLFSYKGFNNWDRISTNMAGICALGVAFFPVNVSQACIPCNHCNVLIREPQPWREIVHVVSASFLFLILAFISLVLFTKTDSSKKPTQKKHQRNLIYKWCGVIMIVVMAITFAVQFEPFKHIIKIPHLTFWMESAMLWAFGFSWLVKGQSLLKD